MGEKEGIKFFENIFEISRKATFPALNQGGGLRDQREEQNVSKEQTAFTSPPPGRSRSAPVQPSRVDTDSQGSDVFLGGRKKNLSPLDEIKEGRNMVLGSFGRRSLCPAKNSRCLSSFLHRDHALRESPGAPISHTGPLIPHHAYQRTEDGSHLWCKNYSQHTPVHLGARTGPEL